MVVSFMVLATLISACSDAESDVASQRSPTVKADQRAVVARVDEISTAVKKWESAATVDEAHESAERARNLIVGPTGPSYGDIDENGAIAGVTEVGLLPGLDGSRALATTLADTCAARDVLGGSWTVPKVRWKDVSERVTTWSESNNRFPELASHPQRIVGWATLAVRSNDLNQIHEFAGHAALHARVSQSALRC